MLAHAAWPEYDEAKTKASSVEIAVQVNGKLKATVQVEADCEDAAALEAALADARVAAAVSGMDIVKKIVVKNKIVNLVVRPQAK